MNLPAVAEVLVLILGLGRYPGGGHGNWFQSSCLGNSMDRGAWWVAQSWTQLKRSSSSREKTRRWVYILGFWVLWKMWWGRMKLHVEAHSGVVKSLSHVWLFETPWTLAYQAPPSMGFSREAFQVAQTVKHLSTMRETGGRSLSWEDPLEKKMAIHFSTIAWKIPWTEEPGRLQSMGSQRVGHDWANSLHLLRCGRALIWFLDTWG